MYMVQLIENYNRVYRIPNCVTQCNEFSDWKSTEVSHLFLWIAIGITSIFHSQSGLLQSDLELIYLLYAEITKKPKGLVL